MDGSGVAKGLICVPSDNELHEIEINNQNGKLSLKKGMDKTKLELKFFKNN